MKEDVSFWFKRYQVYDKCIPINELGQWSDKFFTLLFPVHENASLKDEAGFILFYEALFKEFESFVMCSGFKGDVKQLVQELKAYNRVLLENLEADAQAICEGDPAARSINEVVRSYPGFKAIAVHRLAHFLYEKEVMMIPRMLSEYVHGITGIDIHPGAKIGASFCIDHGTGIVIGETCVIGNRVKIYQGVTLGGLSVNKEDADVKRHPTIEDNVVIYAGATILGGATIIGENSVIGGNTFITKSIAADTKVYYNAEGYQKIKS